MAYLYEGIKKMSDEQLRQELAFLETVNFTNAAKETGGRLISTVTDVANAFAELIGSKNPFEYEYKKMNEMVGDSYIKMKLYDRDRLMELLLDKLEAAAKGIMGKSSSEEMSEDKLSRAIINIAADSFNINKYMTPAHKIEEISIKYNNAFLDTLQQYLKKMTPAEEAEAAKTMEAAIGMVSIDVKRSVQQAVMPARFNGAGMIEMLKKQHNTGKLKTTIEILGYDSLPCINAEIRMIFGALKSFRSMGSMHLARLVWVARNAYGRKFFVEPDLLPGYVSPKDKPELDNMDKEYTVLLKQYKAAAELTVKCTESLDNKKKQLEQIEEKYDAALKEYTEAEGIFDSLENKKDDYINNLRPESETKSFYNQVNEGKRRLDRTKESLDKLSKKLETAKENVTAASDALDKAREEEKNITKAKENEVRQRALELKKNWSAYFFRFQFSGEVYEQVVEEFGRNEILCIEEMLKEIHDTHDLSQFSDEDSIVYAYTGNRKPARITFEAWNISNITRD
ncbi:MAG: hypothetical protein ACI4E1_00235 [Lachnospira sp.]